MLFPLSTKLYFQFGVFSNYSCSFCDQFTGDKLSKKKSSHRSGCCYTKWITLNVECESTPLRSLLYLVTKQRKPRNCKNKIYKYAKLTFNRKLTSDRYTNRSKHMSCTSERGIILCHLKWLWHKILPRFVILSFRHHLLSDQYLKNRSTHSTQI